MKKNPHILTARNIHKRFSKPIENYLLKGIDLTVKRGESIAIVGRSGQGKSTLLHILGTLETATSGDLLVDGEAVTFSNKSRIRNQQLAFIFQSFHLLDDFTVIDNILMPARIARKDTQKGSPAYNAALEHLEAVGLSNRAHFYTKLLSGGEKQRVSIARALCNDPDLIFADEPTGNLDEETSAHIQELLLDCVEKHNKALVVVTHDIDFANKCHSCYHLENGLLS